MIFDFLRNADVYRRFDARLAPGFDFLKNMPQDIADGRHELGEGTYATVSRGETSHYSLKQMEAHRLYIDIQFVIEGREIIHTTFTKGLAVDIPYDAKTDVAFFEEPASFSSLRIEAGQFAVFYPTDAHRPIVHEGDAPLNYRKVVVKIPAGS